MKNNNRFPGDSASSELPSWLAAAAVPRRAGGPLEWLRSAGALLGGLISIPLMLLAALGLVLAVYARCLVALLQYLAALGPEPLRAEELVPVRSISRRHDRRVLHR